MDEKSKIIVERFQGRLDMLYRSVEEYLSGQGVTPERKTFRVTEQRPGPYDVQMLKLVKNEKEVASIVPVGAWIIGAEGRVDLRGPLGFESISYFTEGGPAYKSSVSVDGDTDSSDKEPKWIRYYKNVDLEGWYWVESAQLGIARRVDKDIFLSLLERVSDYAFAM